MVSTITNYDTVIEVRRDAAGVYQVPGAAEPEDAHMVATDMDTTDDWGALLGWGPWTRVYRCLDEQGAVRWFFA